jgi:predicted nucleic acid-binding protein
MVLVDTTVWIDFFADRSEPHVTALSELIENEDDLCLFLCKQRRSTDLFVGLASQSGNLLTV